MPGRPPSEVRNAASIRELKQNFRASRPERFATPISRVRSVTEIDMIAMTPIPPTISAIDEITMSARKRPAADLVPQFQHGILRQDVEIVRLIQLELVPDSHDPFDVGDRGLLADAVARDERESE
jgi:hypothetical protein